MARIRSIRPEFWTHPSIAKRSMLARFVMVGLLTNADDEGRLQVDTDMLRALLFATGDVDAVKIQAALEELCEAGLIERYDLDGVPCARVPGWSDSRSWAFQKLDRPTRSRLVPEGASSAPSSAALDERSASARRGLVEDSTRRCRALDERSTNARRRRWSGTWRGRIPTPTLPWRGGRRGDGCAAGRRRGRSHGRRARCGDGDRRGDRARRHRARAGRRAGRHRTRRRRRGQRRARCEARGRRERTRGGGTGARAVEPAAPRPRRAAACGRGRAAAVGDVGRTRAPRALAQQQPPRRPAGASRDAPSRLLGGKSGGARRRPRSPTGAEASSPGRGESPRVTARPAAGDGSDRRPIRRRRPRRRVGLGA